MASIFTKIVNGEIPCYKVAENDQYLAFLDIMPLVEGHALVIPKTEVDYIFDLDDASLAGLHLFAKKVALGIEQVVPCARIALTVIGLEVPHAHVHLIPMTVMNDVNFTNPKLSLSKERMLELSTQIASAIKL